LNWPTRRANEVEVRGASEWAAGLKTVGESGAGNQSPQAVGDVRARWRVGDSCANRMDRSAGPEFGRPVECRRGARGGKKEQNRRGGLERALT